MKFPGNSTQAGYGLVAVLLASSVGMLAIVGMVSFFSDLTSRQNAEKFRRDSDVFGLEVRAILSAQRACTQSFKGLSLNPDAEHSVTQIFNKAGEVEYAVGDEGGDNTLKIESITLRKYRTPAAAGPSVGHIDLYVTTVKKSGKKGINRVNRIIPLRTVSDSSGQLDSCRSMALMENGIWTRTTAIPENIEYSKGRVASGIDSPLEKFHIVGNEWAQIVLENRESKGASQGTLFEAITHKGNSAIPNNSAMHLLAAKGTRDAPRALKQGDRMGAIGFFGYTGGSGDNTWGINKAAPAAIWTRAEGDFSASSVPTSLTLHTTAAVNDSWNFPQHEQLRITPEGEVGIRTQTPHAAVHVHDPVSQGRIAIGGVSDSNKTYSALYFGSDHDYNRNTWTLAHKAEVGNPAQDSFIIERRDTAGTTINPFNILPNANIGIHTIAPSNSLHVVGQSQFDQSVTVAGRLNSIQNLNIGGNIAYASQVIARSDRRLKKNIRDIEGPILAKLRTLKTKLFNWKNESDSEDPQLGLIAQDVQSLFPEVVIEAEDGTLAIDYPALTSILLKGLNEFNEESATACTSAKQRLRRQEERSRQLEKTKERLVVLRAQLENLREIKQR